MKTLTPSQVKEFIINAIRIKEIPYIGGPPGIGKSDIHAEIADEFGLLLLDIRLSQKLPEDLTGLPSLDEVTSKAKYNPFDTFPMEGDEIPDGYNGWMVFLDELSSASEEVMAAIYSLLLGHSVGGKKLHKDAIIVSAGNRESDSAIARRLPDTLLTRLLPCEMKVSSKDWIKWAKSTSIHDTVIDLIAKYPDMLLGTIPAENRGELETYATPRGWGKVSKLIYLHEDTSKSNHITRKDSAGISTTDDFLGLPIPPSIRALIFSAVGTMSGQAITEHYNESIQVPFPWEVAQSPTSIRIPNTTIGKAKLTSDLAEHFIDTAEQSRDSILQFMNRMDKEYASLFSEIIKEKLGNTVSNKKMIDDIRKRLNVDLIDIE